ncbi:5703_t:CDS:1, partial [Dentiscutata erythropus]
MNTEEYEQMKQYLETSNLPQSLNLEKQKRSISKSQFFECRNGLLYKKDRRSQSKEKLLKVIKKDEVEAILYLMHDHPTGGYFGADNMFRKLKSYITSHK